MEPDQRVKNDQEIEEKALQRFGMLRLEAHPEPAESRGPGDTDCNDPAC
jgi:hypothetical protein